MKKFIVPVLAVVLAIGFSAFTPAHKTQRTGMVLYWYEVDATSQRILAGTPVFAHTDKENLDTPCDDSGELDCLRGFSTPQNTSTDITASGTEQVHYSRQ